MLRRLGVVLLCAGLPACAARARMCSGVGECGKTSACVAGRCQRDGATAAISTTRRLVIQPVDVAFIRRGDAPAHGALPTVFTMGRDGDGSAVLLLRFSVPLAIDASIVEAYLVLERSDAVDTDPLPVTIHAARITDPWSGRGVTWATQPRIEETRSPSTTVSPSGRPIVRVDVSALVRGWRAHDRRDQGIAVVADSSSASGIAFAFAPTLLPPGEGETHASGEDGRLAAPADPPRLEIYLK